MNENCEIQNNKIMTSWAQFGYYCLFSIPVIGWIFIIYYSLENSFVARRNFARSFLCAIIVLIPLLIITGYGIHIYMNSFNMEEYFAPFSASYSNSAYINYNEGGN